MKKFLFALTSLFFVATNVQALELTEGKEYIELNTVKSVQPEVIEFFSFYCPHCYNFEYKYNIPEKVQADIPKNVELKQYHVNFLGRQSEDLTRAWSLAMVLNVETKVKQPLFEQAQKNAIKSMNDIRQIFLDNGVTAEQFDGGINSFIVTTLFNKQVKLAEQFNVHGVPDFYVNGKFRVNPEGFPQTEDKFIETYVKTIKGLLQK
ncbi:thiol:disulfide interchange protein DsbA [Bisgaardia hudsonensis]|uniref:Thiol:disulfide interchange protein n=1 Tax=Bisgaardia hudsonensis TaxID=109472 RepID=A0A4R2MWV3_9PAST|nr:DsbA family protein [Bisgaardia hudsonensis]QLB13778.1 thiol:disulfide interchange protein [Bisgaardia hudsonensis]TCP11739.1 thiol:disulfide interchange protein DsbA [Bisgaardia hudsonensis]